MPEGSFEGKTVSQYWIHGQRVHKERPCDVSISDPSPVYLGRRIKRSLKKAIVENTTKRREYLHPSESGLLPSQASDAKMDWSAGERQTIFPKTILFIGAGYSMLATMLLGYLLASTPKSTKFVCIVHLSGNMTADTHVRRSLEAANIWLPRFASRLICHIGGCARDKMFGLKTVEYRWLIEHVDSIVFAEVPTALEVGIEAKFENAPANSCLALDYVFQFAFAEGCHRPLHVIIPIAANPPVFGAFIDEEARHVVVDELFDSSTSPEALIRSFPHETGCVSGPLWSAIVIEDALQTAAALHFPVIMYRIPPIHFSYQGGDIQLSEVFLDICLIRQQIPKSQSDGYPIGLMCADATLRRLARLMSVMPQSMAGESDAGPVCGQVYNVVPKVSEGWKLHWLTEKQIILWAADFGLSFDGKGKDSLEVVDYAEWRKGALNDVDLTKSKRWTYYQEGICMLDELAPYWFATLEDTKQRIKPSLVLVNDSYRRALRGAEEQVRSHAKNAPNVVEVFASNLLAMQKAGRPGQGLGQLGIDVLSLQRIETMPQVWELRHPEDSLNSHPRGCQEMLWPHPKQSFLKRLSLILKGVDRHMAAGMKKSWQLFMSHEVVRVRRSVEFVFTRVSDNLNTKLDKTISELDKFLVNELPVQELIVYNKKQVANWIGRTAARETSITPLAADFKEMLMDFKSSKANDLEHPMVQSAIAGFCILLRSAIAESVITPQVAATLQRYLLTAANCLLTIVRWLFERSWRLRRGATRSPPVLEGTEGENVHPEDVLLFKKTQIVEVLLDNALFITSFDPNAAPLIMGLLALDPQNFMTLISSEVIAPTATLSNETGWPQLDSAYADAKVALPANAHANGNFLVMREGCYAGGTSWGGIAPSDPESSASVCFHAPGYRGEQIWHEYLYSDVMHRDHEHADVEISQNVPLIHERRQLHAEYIWKRLRDISDLPYRAHSAIELRENALDISSLFELLGRSPTFETWLHVPSYVRWLHSNDAKELSCALKYVRLFLHFIGHCRLSVDSPGTLSPSSLQSEAIDIDIATPRRITGSSIRADSMDNRKHAACPAFPRLVLNVPHCLWAILTELSCVFRHHEMLAIHAPPERAVLERLGRACDRSSDVFLRGIFEADSSDGGEVADYCESFLLSVDPQESTAYREELRSVSASDKKLTRAGSSVTAMMADTLKKSADMTIVKHWGSDGATSETPSEGGEGLPLDGPMEALLKGRATASISADCEAFMSYRRSHDSHAESETIKDISVQQLFGNLAHEMSVSIFPFAAFSRDPITGIQFRPPSVRGGGTPSRDGRRTMTLPARARMLEVISNVNPSLQAAVKLYRIMNRFHPRPVEMGDYASRYVSDMEKKKNTSSLLRSIGLSSRSNHRVKDGDRSKQLDEIKQNLTPKADDMLTTSQSAISKLAHVMEGMFQR